MQTLFGFELSTQQSVIVASVVILVLLLLLGVAVRQIQGGRLRIKGAGGPRARQPRLGVVDTHDLDSQRKLVLIRRDNVEHLIMVGGVSDIVVETNIMRSGARASTQAPSEQAMQERPSATEGHREEPSRMPAPSDTMRPGDMRGLSVDAGARPAAITAGAPEFAALTAAMAMTKAPSFAREHAPVSPISAGEFDDMARQLEEALQRPFSAVRPAAPTVDVQPVEMRTIEPPLRLEPVRDAVAAPVTPAPEPDPEPAPRFTPQPRSVSMPDLAVAPPAAVFMTPPAPVIATVPERTQAPAPSPLSDVEAELEQALGLVPYTTGASQRQPVMDAPPEPVVDVAQKPVMDAMPEPAMEASPPTEQSAPVVPSPPRPSRTTVAAELAALFAGADAALTRKAEPKPAQTTIAPTPEPAAPPLPEPQADPIVEPDDETLFERTPEREAEPVAPVVIKTDMDRVASFEHDALPETTTETDLDIKADAGPLKVETAPAQVETAPAQVETAPAKVETAAAKIDPFSVDAIEAEFARLLGRDIKPKS